MKRVNQYHFYQLGTVIHPLIEIKDGATIGDTFIVCLNAKGLAGIIAGGPTDAAGYFAFSRSKAPECC